MKRQERIKHGGNAAGKTVLFILCILLCLVTAAGTAAAVFLIENDCYKDKTDLLNDNLSINLFNESFTIMTAALGKEDYADHLSENAAYAFWIYDYDAKSNQKGELFLTNHESEDLSDCVEGVFSSRIFCLSEEEDWRSLKWVIDLNATEEDDCRYYATEVRVKKDIVDQRTDNASLMIMLISVLYPVRYAVFGIIAAALLGSILCFIALMCISGRRKGLNGLYPGPLNVIPFDVMLAVAAAAEIGLFILFEKLFRRDPYFMNLNESSVSRTIIIYGCICAVYIIISFSILIGLCMSLAVRVKQHTLIKKTLIATILCLIWKALKAIGRAAAGFLDDLPFIPKTLLGAAILILLDILALNQIKNYAVFRYTGAYNFVRVVFIIKMIAAVFVMWVAMQMKNLQKGGEALAAGDLSYQTDTSRMIWNLKKHGNDLNSIADGMSIAVDEKMKSERMKTELITNVSHDLKTPLTSVINYAGLINSEETENENIKEYSEVLMRQSERLKRLIEDLVEASKASSGTLEVESAPCSPAVFLEQAAGEYDDRLKAAGLELIVKTPEEDMKIMADGRRMQRIFDNLLNNVCKYAQSGTRVYLSLEKQADDAVITLKNTSAAALNISADELMERFVRGDSSRNTEGNGLGLSIAKNLAQLQGGSLDLNIDGDLFKAILRFPVTSGSGSAPQAQESSPPEHINMIKYS